MFAALIILGTINPWALNPKSLADCDALVAQHPRDFEAYFCYMRMAFRDPHEEWAAKTMKHLRARLSKQPDDQLARLMLALAGGDDAEDEPLYLEAARGLHEQGILAGEVSARTALAVNDCNEGRFFDAEKQLALALQAAKASGDPDMLSQTEGYTGKCALDEADYGRAISLYRQSRERLLAGPQTWRTGWLLGNALDGLGQLYARTGRHQEALEIFQAQLEALKTNSFTHACAEHRVASEAMRLARAGGMSWDEADAYLHRALDDEVKVGCRYYINGGELWTRMLLAERLGPTDAGLREANATVALTRSLDAEPIHRCAPLRLLALFTIEHDPSAKAAALALVEEAIDIAQRYGSHLDLAEGLLVRAEVRMRSGDRAQGLADALAALDGFDRVRALQPDEMVRARSATEWSSAYHGVAALLLEEDSPARAFETMERLRSRSLFELLSPPSQGPQAEPIRQQRRELLVSLSHLQRELLKESLDSSQRALDLAELDRLESRDEGLRDQLARAAGPLPLSPSVTLDQVRAELAPDEAMLVFQLLEPDVDEGGRSGRATVAGLSDRASSWLLSISHQEVRAIRIPDAAALGGEVDLLAGLIARRDGSETSGAAVLYQQLLRDAMAAMGPSIKRLVLVPDGPLHRLPFEALRDEHGQALAERVELSVAPSASLWMRWRTRDASIATIPALALGDPSLSRGDPAFALAERNGRGGEGAGSPALSSGSPAVSSGSPADRSASLADLYAGSRGGSDLLASLPAAREEALSVARILSHGSVVKLGADASEELIKTADLKSYGVVHFAAHALVDELRPERSAILLAPGSPSEDGLLQVREIAGLDLRGCTVVLATCNSSSGELLQGEGVMSLARGFFQAGAGAVIGSLWPLRDDEAALFFDAFYKKLSEGARLSEAVAHARRARIAAHAPAAAWAGLLVIGNGNAVPIPPALRASPPVHRAALAGVGLAIAALAIGLLYRARIGSLRS